MYKQLLKLLANRYKLNLSTQISCDNIYHYKDKHLSINYTDYRVDMLLSYLIFCSKVYL